MNEETRKDLNGDVNTILRSNKQQTELGRCRRKNLGENLGIR